jgi:hypothetical protein
MARYHDNKLTMVGLDSDDDEKPFASSMSNKRKRSSNNNNNNAMTTPQDHTSHFSAINGVDGMNGYDRPFDPWATIPSTETCGQSFEDLYMSNYDFDDTFNSAALSQDALFGRNDHVRPVPNMTAGVNQVEGHGTRVKSEVDESPLKSEDRSDHAGSLYSSPGGSNYADSDHEERRKPKTPKLNKDGCPRKPREPRPKLLKWDDNDWKMVALALVWSCGENDISIPFEQAAQIVGENVSAGALQQALLKLRCKMIELGYQIPPLRMAWTRKNKSTAAADSSVDTKTQQTPNGTPKRLPPRRKPTRFAGNQSLLITLKRAYKEEDRHQLVAPYAFQPSALPDMQSDTTNIQDAPQTPNGQAHLTGLPVTKNIQVAPQTPSGQAHLTGLPATFRSTTANPAAGIQFVPAGNRSVLATPPHTPSTGQDWNAAGHYNTPQLAPTPFSPFYAHQSKDGLGCSISPGSLSQESVNFSGERGQRAAIMDYNPNYVYTSPSSDSFGLGTGSSSPDMALNGCSPTQLYFNHTFNHQSHAMAMHPSSTHVDGFAAAAAGQSGKVVPQSMRKFNDQPAIDLMGFDECSMDMKFMQGNDEEYHMGDLFSAFGPETTSNGFGGSGGFAA